MTVGGVTYVRVVDVIFSLDMYSQCCPDTAYRFTNSTMTDTSNSTDRSPEPITEPIGFSYDPLRGPTGKIEFTPRADGRFNRVEAVWTGCTWRETGLEIVRTIRPL